MTQLENDLNHNPESPSATPSAYPTLTVIVPVWGYPVDKLLQLIVLLKQTTHPERTEIVLMDDCNPQYNLPMVPLPLPLRVMRNEVNLGFAGNCNAGAAVAQGEVLIFLNQDIRPTHGGWADRMLEVLGRENAGIVGPRLVFGNGAVQSVGGLFDAGKGPYHRDLGWSDAFCPRLSMDERISWTTGAALMIRRADFLAVGGFDVGYVGGYFEDVDLCLKMRTQLHKEVWYCAGATLVHEVGSTGGNPKFMENSLRFHRLWDQHIVPDTMFVHVTF